LEADIESFFDSVIARALMAMLQSGWPTRRLLALVGSALHVGILDGEEYSEPTEGTAQGASLSPLLGQHLPASRARPWFERDELPRMEGKAHLDPLWPMTFVIGFEKENDAKPCVGRPANRASSGTGYDCTRKRPACCRSGRPERRHRTARAKWASTSWASPSLLAADPDEAWRPGPQDRTARLREPPGRRRVVSKPSTRPGQGAERRLARRLNGHYNYFGVNGNGSSMKLLLHQVKRAWKKWLMPTWPATSIELGALHGVLQLYPLPTQRFESSSG